MVRGQVLANYITVLEWVQMWVGVLGRLLASAKRLIG